MTFIKTVDEALEFIGRSFAHMESKLDQTIPKVQKLEAYPKLPALFGYALSAVGNDGEYHYSSYYKPHECSTIEAVEKRRDALVAICDSAPALLQETFDKNVAIIENNKKVREKITQIMTVCGIPATYVTTDPKSRARIPKRITKPSGYVEDMTRHIPVVDTTYNLIKTNIEKKRKEIETWAKNAIASINEIEKAKAAKEKEDKALQLISVLKVKYDLPFDSDPQFILETFLEKDKYLNLGHAMLSARNEFDNVDFVECAIGSFKVESEFDAEVEKEISYLLRNWDGDGRVFRDCHYNYSILFSKVDSDLMEDYNNLIEHLDEF